MEKIKTDNKEISNKENTWQLYGKVFVVVSIALFLVVLYQTTLISKLKTTGSVISEGSSTVTNTVKASNVIPTGTPKIYGKELSVNYDDILPSDPKKADKTIAILGNLDKQITLSGNDLQRYINIVGQISCEYCCGAKSIIFNNGQPACGCAHSYAMRGLAKYLITKHGKEYTDEEILEELGKWKTLFFPTQITQKAKILQEKGVELNYINLASNKYRGIEAGVSGGMVGGC